MKCPFCNEEIDDNTKICPYCSEKIPAYTKILKKWESVFACLKNIDNTSKKKVASVAGITLLLVGIATGGYIGLDAYLSYINDPSYNSIVIHEYSNYYEYPDTVLSVVGKVLTQNNDLKELMQSKAPKAKKEIVFNTYLDNIDFFASVISYKITNGDWQGLAFNDKVEIEEPKLPMYSSIYDFDSGDFVLRTDYKYLNENFGKYIGNDWKGYFTIKQNGDVFGGQLLNKIIEMEKFVQKYPKFERVNEFNLAQETRNFVAGCYSDSKSCTEKIFENYFKKADKSAKSYTYISGAYEILKKYNWKNEIDELWDLSQKITE